MGKDSAFQKVLSDWAAPDAPVYADPGKSEETPTAEQIAAIRARRKKIMEEAQKRAEERHLRACVDDQKEMDELKVFPTSIGPEAAIKIPEEASDEDKATMQGDNDQMALEQKEAGELFSLLGELAADWYATIRAMKAFAWTILRYILFDALLQNVISASIADRFVALPLVKGKVYHAGLSGGDAANDATIFEPLEEAAADEVVKNLVEKWQESPAKQEPDGYWGSFDGPKADNQGRLVHPFVESVWNGVDCDSDACKDIRAEIDHEVELQNWNPMPLPDASDSAFNKIIAETGALDGIKVVETSAHSARHLVFAYERTMGLTPEPLQTYFDEKMIQKKDLGKDLTEDGKKELDSLKVWDDAAARTLLETNTGSTSPRGGGGGASGVMDQRPSSGATAF
ncbi:unnamed protein product, partial [Amoebophrya sp. A25]